VTAPAVQFPYDADLPMGDLPAGDDGVLVALAAMQAMSDDAAEHSELVQRHAWQIYAPLQPFTDDEQVARAVYDFLAGHVRFRRDPRRLEHVRHPDQLLHD
jgi:hypothetical protein